MDDLYAGKMRYLDSERLRLLAANEQLVRRDLEGGQALAAALGVEVPENWPPPLYDRNMLEASARQLGDPAQRNWSFWYLTLRNTKPPELIGICGFKGRPDEQGVVEISYSVLEQHRNRGYATEAVARLIAWAFTQPSVRAISAETLPHLGQSIRVMEKNGLMFAGKGSEHGVVRYIVRRSSLA